MKLITFVNNKGETVQLPDNLTIKDLARYGVRQFKIEPVGTPIADGWFVDETLSKRAEMEGK
jgi:hypothetical protein